MGPLFVAVLDGLGQHQLELAVVEEDAAALVALVGADELVPLRAGERMRWRLLQTGNVDE